jgi:vacuolar-type H+-ATPase subunit F/Vma7
MGIRCILLADRVTATAYHLAGAEVRQPGKEGVLEAFRRARADSGLLLLSRPLAMKLPGDELTRAIRDARPPVQVINPVYLERASPDAANRARRALGVSR